MVTWFYEETTAPTRDSTNPGRAGLPVCVCFETLVTVCDRHVLPGSKAEGGRRGEAHCGRTVPARNEVVASALTRTVDRFDWWWLCVDTGNDRMPHIRGPIGVYR